MQIRARREVGSSQRMQNQPVPATYLPAWSERPPVPLNRIDAPQKRGSIYRRIIVAQPVASRGQCWIFALHRAGHDSVDEQSLAPGEQDDFSHGNFAELGALNGN